MEVGVVQNLGLQIKYCRKDRRREYIIPPGLIYTVWGGLESLRLWLYQRCDVIRTG